MISSDMQDLLGQPGTTSQRSSSPTAPSPLMTEMEKKVRSPRSLHIPAQKKPPTKGELGGSFKKPEGMHRELYNLLDKNAVEISSVMPTQTMKGTYRNAKAKIGSRAVHHWEWTVFSNEARVDGLKLCHWQRADRLHSTPYPFARFNKAINIVEYTDEEYEKHLQSPKWSKAETDHLFSLCRLFDLRWPIVEDRWERSRFREKRSMEDMKERFYAVTNVVNAVRATGADVLCYDAEHERRRKDQLTKLWNRPLNMIEEEEMLTAELKKIEGRRKEREKRALDLQKLITSTPRAPMSPSIRQLLSLLLPISGFSASTIASPAGPGYGQAMKKKSIFRKGGSVASFISQSGAFSSAEHGGLRFSEFRSAGAHLRSQEMKLPTNVGQKKLKNIDTVVEKLKLDPMPYGAEELVTAFNDFRSDVILLQELKSALQTAEFELETLRNRYQNQTGKSFEIEPRMRVSCPTEEDTEEVIQGLTEGTPASSRIITDMIELSAATVPLVRKRKLASTPQPEVKRSRRS